MYSGLDKIWPQLQWPWFSRRLKALIFAPPQNWNWFWQPIGWFLAAIFLSVLVGSFVAPQGWLLAAALVVVLCGGIVGPWLCLLGVCGELVFERRRCSENQIIVARIKIDNRLPWPGWGFLLTGGFNSASDGESSSAVAALARIPGWSRMELEFPLRPSRRGRYPVEPMFLACGFPFGIWHARKAILIRDELLVVPQVFSPRGLPRLPGDAGAAVGAFRDRVGSDGEILASRDYRSGDALRQVNWRHTARRDTLIVNERQSTGRPCVLLLWDETAFSGPEISQNAVDWGIRVFATLAGHFFRHAYTVTCSLGASVQCVIASAGQWRQFLDLLAVYEAPPEPLINNRVGAKNAKAFAWAFALSAELPSIHESAMLAGLPIAA